MTLKRFIPLMVVLGSGSVMADTIEHKIHIEATVPTETFYVSPVGNWIGETQILSLDSRTGNFSSIQRKMQARSTIGPISGYLLSDAAITRVNGDEKIGLSIEFGDKTLTTTSQQVMDFDTAKKPGGTYVDFKIVPDKKPEGGYKVGIYEGSVNMIFESVAPSK